MLKHQFLTFIPVYFCIKNIYYANFSFTEVLNSIMIYFNLFLFECLILNVRSVLKKASGERINRFTKITHSTNSTLNLIDYIECLKKNKSFL